MTLAIIYNLRFYTKILWRSHITCPSHKHSCTHTHAQPCLLQSPRLCVGWTSPVPYVRYALYSFFTTFVMFWETRSVFSAPCCCFVIGSTCHVSLVACHWCVIITWLGCDISGCVRRPRGWVLQWVLNLFSTTSRWETVLCFKSQHGVK